MRALVGAVTAGVFVTGLLGGCGGGGGNNALRPTDDDPPATTTPDDSTTTASTPPPESTSTASDEVLLTTDPCAAAGIEVEGCADFGNIEVTTDADDNITVAGPEGSRTYSPSEAVGELGGSVSDKGIAVPLPDSVLFDFGSVALRPASREKISLVAGLAKASPDAKIDIGGHTDAVGTDDFNQRLSEARAGVVREALVILGIERSRITSVGYGESRPVAPNTNPDGSDNPGGRQQNRRVEILLAGAQV
jgi:outer membrane protein OmpA-like peptidoglycan-associated protein